MPTSVSLLFALAFVVTCNGSGAVPVQKINGEDNAVIRKNDRLSRNSNRDWSFHHTWSLPHFPSLPSVTSFFHDNDDEDVKLRKRIEALEKTQVVVLDLLKKLTEATKISPNAEKHEASPASEPQKPKPVNIKKPQVPTTTGNTKIPGNVIKPTRKPPASITGDNSNISNKPSSNNDVPKPNTADDKNVGKPETVQTPVPNPANAESNDGKGSSSQANNDEAKQPAADDKNNDKPGKESSTLKPTTAENNDGKGTSDEAQNNNETVKPITTEAGSEKDTSTASKNDGKLEKPATKPNKQQTSHDGPESTQINAGPSNAQVDAVAGEKENMDVGSGSAIGIAESANSGKGPLSKPLAEGVAVGISSEGSGSHGSSGSGDFGYASA